jgi:hypothetical protein
VPSDVAAGSAGRGDGDAGLDGDLEMSGLTVTWTVLRAWARPTWIFWPSAMIDPQTETRRVTTRSLGNWGCRAVPGRSSGGTGQATVRMMTPAARTWATGPSRRRVMRCPASGSPALMTWSPRLTLPDAFTVRSTSVTSPAAAGSGGGPVGLGSGRGEAGLVAGVEPGRQGLEVAVEQDVNLAEASSAT